LLACGFFRVCGYVSSLKMLFRFLGLFMGLLGVLQKMICIFLVLLKISPTGAIPRDGDYVGREPWFFTGYCFSVRTLYAWLSEICQLCFDLSISRCTSKKRINKRIKE
jgi:uncharacterized membrane protein